MTIIVYDGLGWNSFISQVDMDAQADTYINADQWNALTTDDKDRYLAQSTRDISSLPGITIPAVADTTTDCLPQIQASWIMKDLKYSISVQTSTRETQSEQVGALKVSYFESGTNQDVDPVPEGSSSCLEALGYSVTASDLVFGSIRKVR